MNNPPCDTGSISYPAARQGLQHCRFGDLSRKSSVIIKAKNNHSFFSYTDSSPALIHLSITGRCYARCRGCINSSITMSFTGDRNEIAPVGDALPERDAACIVNLIREQKKPGATVCFYGGEPLLATDKIESVIKIIDAAKLTNNILYMLYTNGDLLKGAVADYPQLMRKLWLTAVSIDGGRSQHERARPGTNLTKIHQGLKALKGIRTGAVLMWSTLREDQSLADCFREFLDLHNRGWADQFFWHWVETKEPFNDLRGYAERYENELTAIMETYLNWIENGRLLSLPHINELVLYILTGKKRNSSACGVELADNFDLIGGKIHSCADLPQELAIGRIADNGEPLFTDYDLSPLVAYKESLGCYRCGVHDYCGGRCPVQAYTSCVERLTQYCQLMRLHVGIVMEYAEKIVNAMYKHNITPQKIYDESAHYTFFTDVTP